MKKERRDSIIEKASKQVGAGVFYSTIVVVSSFLPVFMLTGMEGKMFHPLAFTKTFILLIDAFLAISLTPVLISFLLKGKLKPENANPVTRMSERIYTPILKLCLKYRKSTLGINNSLGTPVITLVANQTMQAGNYSEVAVLSGLSTGYYYVKLTFDNGIRKIQKTIKLAKK